MGEFDLNKPQNYILFLCGIIIILFILAELVRHMYQKNILVKDEDILIELEADRINHLGKLRRHLRENHIKDPDLRAKLEKYLVENEKITIDEMKEIVSSFFDKKK